MHKILTTVGFLALFSTPVLADAQEDAEFIANVTVNKEIVQGALVAMRPTLVQVVQNSLNSKDIKVSDPEAFFDIAMDAFMDEFVQEMRIPTAQFYVENFSTSELNDIAQFYNSPAGKSLLRMMPAMMQNGAKAGQAAGVKAFQMVNPEIARRIREEDLVIENKSLTDKLLEAFE